MWTSEQIIHIAEIIFGFFATGLLTVGGWVVVSKLNRANTEKAKAEAINIYRKMLDEAAEREKKLYDKLYALEREMEKLIISVEEKNQENAALKRKVAELSVQADTQALKIIELEGELHSLRLKRTK